MDTSTITFSKRFLLIKSIWKKTFFCFYKTKSSNKQKPTNTKNGNTPSRNNRNINQIDPVESEEEIAKKIDLLRTILLSCDDWLSIDDLLKVYIKTKLIVRNIIFFFF
jgi:hypothetical protein